MTITMFPVQLGTTVLSNSNLAFKSEKPQGRPKFNFSLTTYSSKVICLNNLLLSYSKIG